MVGLSLFPGLCVYPDRGRELCKSGWRNRDVGCALVGDHGTNVLDGDPIPDRVEHF